VFRATLVLAVAGCFTKPPPPELDCPTSYDRVGTGFYRVDAEIAAPFATAEARCEADRGDHGSYTHLAVFANATEPTAELTRVATYAFSAQTSRVWVGSSKETLGAFAWVTDEGPGPTNDMWSNGEPNNLPTEHCVAIHDATFLLHDASCPMTGYRFVCECDAYAVNHDNF
jgi:hypothetical protein